MEICNVWYEKLSGILIRDFSIMCHSNCTLLFHELLQISLMKSVLKAQNSLRCFRSLTWRLILTEVNTFCCLGLKITNKKQESVQEGHDKYNIYLGLGFFASCSYVLVHPNSHFIITKCSVLVLTKFI